jgi:hypothetical protein
MKATSDEIKKNATFRPINPDPQFVRDVFPAALVGIPLLVIFVGGLLFLCFIIFRKKMYRSASIVKTGSLKRDLSAFAGTVIKLAGRKRFFICILLLTVLFYALVVFPGATKNPQLEKEAYRDITYVQNILNGNSVFSDPMIKGELSWYPPLGISIMALVSKVTGMSAIETYDYSVFFINAFIPLLFYLLVSLVFGKRFGFFTALLIPVMPWLNNILFINTTAPVQSIGFVLISLILFVIFDKKGFTLSTSIVTGVMMGLAFLFHPVSGAILYSSIGVYVLIRKFIFKQSYRGLHILIAAAIPVLLFGPFLVPHIIRRVLNPAPFDFVSPRLFDPAWTVFVPNEYLAVVSGLLILFGIGRLARNIRSSNALLFFVLVGVTLAGQGCGYLHSLKDHPSGFFRFTANIPFVLPHEFQWYFQLFMLVFLAYGFFSVLDDILKGQKNRLVLVLFIAFLLPGYFKLVDNNRIKPGSAESGIPPYAKWVMNNTDKNAVFCLDDPAAALTGFNPFTARKIVYNAYAWINPHVDAAGRERDNNLFFRSSDVASMKAIAHRYGMDYALVSKNGDMPADRVRLFRDNFTILYEDYEYVIFDIKSALK